MSIGLYSLVFVFESRGPGKTDCKEPRKTVYEKNTQQGYLFSVYTYVY